MLNAIYGQWACVGVVAIRMAKLQWQVQHVAIVLINIWLAYTLYTNANV